MKKLISWKEAAIDKVIEWAVFVVYYIIICPILHIVMYILYDLDRKKFGRRE